MKDYLFSLDSGQAFRWQSLDYQGKTYYKGVLGDTFYFFSKEDIEEIEKSLKYLIGPHNFKSFTKTNIEKDDYIRTIYDINISLDRDILTITFRGNGFLRYMVRNIVGTLIEIGENKRKSTDIKHIIESEDRTLAGKTASPVGLYLKDVKYNI